MKKYSPHLFAAAIFLALLSSKFDLEYGFTELAGFGKDSERVKIEAIRTLPVYSKANSTGYDGQFYTQIALDPTLRDPEFPDAIDHPSYRARRILLPAVAYIIGLGQAPAVIQIHSLLNVACFFILGMLLLRWIPPNGARNLARWACCMFSMGVMESIRYSLTDLPSLTLALATIALIESKKGKLAFLSNALSVLTKETALIHAITFLSPTKGKPHLPIRHFWRATFAVLISLAVLGIWMAYVTSVFPITLNSTDNIGLPFGGLYWGFTDALAHLRDNGFSDRHFFRILAILGLLFQFGYLVARPNTHSRIWLLGIAYGILFVTLGIAVWRGYWAGCRIALPITVAFNILFTAKNDKLFWIVMVLTNLSLIHGIIRWL